MESGKTQKRKKSRETKAARKLEIAKDVDAQEDDSCMTFILHDEDHTLGNSLRYIIMKNPDVLFCGYNTPHPSESKINFRIQTNGVPALSVLQKGLKDLSQLSRHVLQTFEQAVIRFRSTHGAMEGENSSSHGEDSD